jgi:hypothetical protein
MFAIINCDTQIRHVWPVLSTRCCHGNAPDMCDRYCQQGAAMGIHQSSVTGTVNKVLPWECKSILAKYFAHVSCIMYGHFRAWNVSIVLIVDNAISMYTNVTFWVDLLLYKQWMICLSHISMMLQTRQTWLTSHPLIIPHSLSKRGTWRNWNFHNTFNKVLLWGFIPRDQHK